MPNAKNVGDDKDELPLHVVHCHPEAMGVYPAGLYIANFTFEFGLNSPGAAAAVDPRSSKILSVYVACTSGFAFGSFCCAYASHIIWVAVPGITPSTVPCAPVGPTLYVFPFAEQYAWTVNAAGVEIKLV